jgi:hypothetical protein
MVAVFDGRVALGTVRRDERSGRYSATTPTGRILGSYTTREAACDALARHEQRSRDERDREGHSQC